MADIEKELATLSEEIKQRNYPKLYFFSGKEKYLKKFYIDKIVESLLDENSRDMNYDIITEDKYNFERVRESINTLPFFAEKRVVLLNEINILNKNELAPLFENIPEDVLVIINELSIKRKKESTDKKEEDTEIDDNKGKKKLDVVKAIKKIGRIIEIEKISDSIAVKKIISVAKQNGKQISKIDSEYMVARIGIDLSLILNELDKLISYVNEKEIISKKDIDEICVQSLESKIFDLIKSICAKKIDSAIKQYHNMITNKEPQVLMLYMIARQYMMMYEAVLLDKKGYTIKQIAEKTEAKQEFVAKECLMQGNKYGIKKLESIIKECLEVDSRLKLGEDVLEVFIYKLMLEY